MTLLNEAQALKEWSVMHRRHLHEHPELSLQEHATSAYCQKILADLGYKITVIWETGFIADLDCGASHRIAYRADMDALPVEEKNHHDFISKTPGVSHVCGHDAHMAIALTTARMLSEKKSQLTSNIRFIFQPSEEVLPGGALGMIAHGALEGVNEVFGLHNDPKTPIGTLRCLEGAMTASCDTFHCTIRGKGGHASSPHTALDPVYMTALVITELNTVISRRIAPMHPAVLSITYVHAGEVQNAIPDESQFGGVIRSFNPTDRALIKSIIMQVLEGKQLLGYQTSIDFTESYPSIINSRLGQERVVNAAKGILSAGHLITNGHPEAWGEDFAYYLHHRPGAFYILGSGNAASGITEPLHSSHFDIDENILPLGAAVMVQLALKV